MKGATLAGALDKLPLAAAHVRGGEPIAPFEDEASAVSALGVLSREQGVKLQAWAQKKADEPVDVPA